MVAVNLIFLCREGGDCDEEKCGFVCKGGIGLVARDERGIADVEVNFEVYPPWGDAEYMEHRLILEHRTGVVSLNFSNKKVSLERSISCLRCV